MSNISFDYSKTNILVTGGTSGIGKAIAEAYLTAGADVTITGTKSSLQKYSNITDKFSYIKLNLEDKESIDNIKKSVNTLDILINNGGLTFPDGKSEDDPDIFDRAVYIHLNSFYRLSNLLHPILKKSNIQGGASIIGIASMTSFFGMPIVPGYGAGKGGLVQLIKTLSMKWANDPIRVNAIAAGFIKTRMTEPILSSEEMSQDIINRIALKKFGDPIDIANAVLFMTSPAASYITGETLRVDGGYSISS
ncbi:MAG: SDR family oxidoreductase [Pseudomonadota bacterium]|nr:SDR family oxidoreductase [Pseudomonadota bacterium]